MPNKYIPLQELEVYQLARKLSKIGWTIFETFDWQTKRSIGNQFITATDSIGANIAEGYGRFHYLEKIKFFYNARGSLTEAADHWLELLKERRNLSDEMYREFREAANELSLKLQNFISVNYQARRAAQQ